MTKKFYVTTAIDYANDIVHVGHSYQKMVADVLARYHRLIEDETYFLTGTDEHGQKVENSAKECGMDPKEFVDRIAAADKAEWDSLNISYDRFIRTTDEDHVKFAQKFYLKSKAAGDIYLGRYDGLYCEGCEAYLSEPDLVSGRCFFHPNQEPLRLSEENYFFRLSKYQKFLEKLIEEDPTFVVPESKRREALSFVKMGLKDFAVSRPNIRWGIPVPDDPKQTIYVWFDALINYLTYAVEQNCWPADIHVLGKDNLRFHAIYWPAMLKSAGYKLPKTILVHDFISINGQKISKSLGNVIRPSELVEQFGIDAIRYFFLRYGPLKNDIDFTLEKLKEVYNADLANGLGNLVGRIATLSQKSNFNFKPTPTSLTHSAYTQAFRQLRFNDILSLIWKKIKEMDQLIDKTKPWELEGQKLEEVLEKLVGQLRQIAAVLEPFIPKTSQEIQKQFKGPKIKSNPPLFPRI